MKKLKIIAASITTIFVVICGTYFYNTKNFYKLGENGSFKLKVGEEFTIKLNENPSTGYSNCLLNENLINCVQKINESYDADWNPNKLDGAGGELIIKFKAIKKGTDTLKMSNCPVYAERKSCKDFNTSNAQIDNEFYVTVE